MGKDKRPWRKQVKKLRRQLKRRALARSQLPSVETFDKEDEEEEEEEENKDGTFFISRNDWEEREEQARLEYCLKKAFEDRMAEIETEKQKKIKEEWETKQEQERKLRDEKERLEKQIMEKKEADFNEFLSFLSGDIETPPTKYLMPEDVGDETEVCYFFSKTATCRFRDMCTKQHPRPTLSTAILIPNFFSHFKLEKAIRDEYNADIGLEYEDNELHKEFLEFYNDVVPELRKSGNLIQFKVCCNFEPHLRGNVYIQYETIRESFEVAFRKFNGRFYNGKQLSLEFIRMDSWRSAICGSFQRKTCLKGSTCNYLHVFRNPTKEFVQADRDWKTFQHPASTTRKSVVYNHVVSQELIKAVEAPNELKISDHTNENKTELTRASVRNTKLTKPINSLSSSSPRHSSQKGHNGHYLTMTEGNMETHSNSSLRKRHKTSLEKKSSSKKHKKKSKSKEKKSKKHKKKKKKHDRNSK